MDCIRIPYPAALATHELVRDLRYIKAGGSSYEDTIPIMNFAFVSLLIRQRMDDYHR